MIGYSWGKVKESVSGWEKSHFGGFYRMIADYPYIRLDYSVKIVASTALSKELGWYTSETLIKLFLLKLKAAKGLGYLSTDVVEKPSLLGITMKKYEVTTITSTAVNYLINVEEDSEYAPLFDYYRLMLEGSQLEKELPEEEGDDNDGDGDGDDEEDDKDQDSKSKDGSPTGSVINAIESMVEFKPKDGFTSLSGFDQDPVFKAFDTSHIADYKFSWNEIKDAENLYKLLDISFEPKSDVVKSLRAGQLDVQKIAEVPAGSTSIYKQTVEDVDTKPFGICILADLSGSMSGEKINMQKKILNTLYLTMSQIVPSDKLWIYGHTGDCNPDIYTFCSPYDNEYAKNISMYDSIDLQQNYDGPVIEAIHKKIRDNTDDRIIFISLSDGSPCGMGYGGEDDVTDMKKIMERARRDDFITVGIGIQYMQSANLYQYSITVNNLEELVKDASKLINKVVLTEFK